VLGNVPWAATRAQKVLEQIAPGGVPADHVGRSMDAEVLQRRCGEARGEASFEAGRMIKEWPRERDDDRPARATELMGPARSADREPGGAGGAPQV
jgi:hypothetical protein